MESLEKPTEWRKLICKWDEACGDERVFINKKKNYPIFKIGYIILPELKDWVIKKIQLFRLLDLEDRVTASISGRWLDL